MRPLALAAVFAALPACHSGTPAGTLVADWTYPSSDADAHRAPAPKIPPQVVTTFADWPGSASAPVKLQFETEIGDLASDVHWNWPRRIRITLAEPTRAELPQVDCMPGPPGNRVVGDKLVRPLGRDGMTPTGMVACFFSDMTGSHTVFNVDGDGDVSVNVTRPVPSRPPVLR